MISSGMIRFLGIPALGAVLTISTALALPILPGNEHPHGAADVTWHHDGAPGGAINDPKAAKEAFGYPCDPNGTGNVVIKGLSKD